MSLDTNTAKGTLKLFLLIICVVLYALGALLFWTSPADSAEYTSGATEEWCPADINRDG